MLLSPFRSNQFSASLLLIFYATVLHIPAYWSRQLGLAANDAGASVLGKWMNTWTSWSDPWALILPIMLLFIAGVIINRLTMRDHLGSSDTQFAGLFYILVGSYVAAFFPPNSMQLANLFLLFALFPFLALYKHQGAVVPLFWSGWWLGFAFLTNSYYIIFLMAFMFAIPIFQPISLRRVFQLVSGWGAPLFLLFCKNYLSDTNDAFLSSLWNGVGYPGFYGAEGYWTYVGLGVLGLCMIWVFLARGKMASQLQTDARYKIQVLYAVLIFAVLSLFLQQLISASSLQIVVLPLGVLLGLVFSGLERSRGESLHLLLLGVFVAMQLLPFYLKY